MAGTMSAGLRAGIPNVVVPFIVDQPFLRSRVYTVVVGLKPILVNNFFVDKLTCAIIEAETKLIRERVQFVGQRIRNEHGVESAVQLIETYSSEFMMNVDFVF